MNDTGLSDSDYEVLHALVKRVRIGSLEDFKTQGENCGWCAHPVRLRGMVVRGDGDDRRVSFSSRSLPDGVVLKACGSRRETRCPSCAAVYRADARHLVRAGLIGGKGVDESVAERPAVFLTFTAPSFGIVHTAKDNKACHVANPQHRCAHGRPLSCFTHHAECDEVVGSPLCPECYDYEGAVLHNAATPELWRRTTIYVIRHLAAVLGLTQRETTSLVKVSFCRVAEYQRRGVVHLHAVIRADGVDGALAPVTADQLALACLKGARAVSVTTARGVARWGKQIDAQSLDRASDRAKRVAGYVAKYATKSAESSGVLDRRITSAEDLAHRQLPPHLKKMAQTAWRLGGDPQLSGLHLRRHAHSLGYSGHFLSKSRGYSTSFTQLRADRAAWTEARQHRGVGSPEVVEGRWHAVGIGWSNRGEAAFAGDQRKYREIGRRLADEDRYSTTASAA